MYSAGFWLELARQKELYICRYSLNNRVRMGKKMRKKANKSSAGNVVSAKVGSTRVIRDTATGRIVSTHKARPASSKAMDETTATFGLALSRLANK